MKRSIGGFFEHLNKKGNPKVSYATLKEAVEAANSETTRLGTFRMVPYLCSYCQTYHIGKPSYYKNETQGNPKTV